MNAWPDWSGWWPLLAFQLWILIVNHLFRPELVFITLLFLGVGTFLRRVPSLGTDGPKT